MTQRTPNPFAEIHLQYFEEGIKTIISTENTGTLMAFQDQDLNQKGLFLNKIDFLGILETHRIEFPIKNIPNKFVLNIKYSPISFFKKWIFCLSNHALLKMSERINQYEVEFFIYHQNNHYVITSLSTNVAHERFLYCLHQKETLDKHQATFKTTFDEKGSIILYKDYILITEHPIIVKHVKPNKIYTLQIEVTKTIKDITYRLKIEHLPIKMYTFSLMPNKMNFKEVRLPKQASIPLKSPSKIEVFAKPSINMEKDHQEVIQLIKAFHETSRLTNKFANIALGRVNKIPVLVNLASHYKDTLVTMKYENEKLSIHNQKQKLIKSLVISKFPKSNWLIKERS